MTRLDQIKAQCKRFHEKHPQVWVLFVRFTNDRISLGFQHYGSKAIFERIRWETDQADVDGESTFKMPNNFTPLYARRFMKVYPEHDGFFRLRIQTSAGRPAFGEEDLLA